MADLSLYDQQSFFSSDKILSGLLQPEDLCFVVQKEISPLIVDSDFEDMYKDGGRPPVSPRILLLTLLMQYIEKLPDRAAAANLKFRLDWKIAFELPLEYAGIHPTTLVYFRDRLIANERASLIFDRIIERLKECGLIKKGGKQRIDSTHIIACVRELSRIELFHETLRLFCLAVEIQKGWMNDTLLAFHEKYLEKISIHGTADVQKKEFIESAGLAMKAFLFWASTTDHADAVTGLAEYKTLKTVFEQNFITHIYVEEATNFDGDCVTEVIEELQKKDIAPRELYGDTHYNTAANIENLNGQSIELKGPVQQEQGNKAEKNMGFEIVLDEQKVTCPVGVVSKHFHRDPQGKVKASFPKDTCHNCARKEICQPEARGKIYEARLENSTLAERRKQLKDRDYKKDLRHRNGVEGTISGLVRGQQWRRCRYRGKTKAKLQAKFTGAAANVCRLHRLRCKQQLQAMI